MLLDRASTTQSFSDLDLSEDSYTSASFATDRPRRRVDRSARSGSLGEGDQVVFARLDLAEALGIWRHALGRVVETHAETDAEAQAAPEAGITVDVKFDGHETLHRYLPDLFEKRTG